MDPWIHGSAAGAAARAAAGAAAGAAASAATACTYYVIIGGRKDIYDHSSPGAPPHPPMVMAPYN